MGAGSQAQVFYKSNKLLSAEPSPQPQDFLMQYILIIVFPFPQRKIKTEKNIFSKTYTQKKWSVFSIDQLFLVKEPSRGEN